MIGLQSSALWLSLYTTVCLRVCWQFILEAYYQHILKLVLVFCHFDFVLGVNQVISYKPNNVVVSTTGHQHVQALTAASTL